jgi:hypothetical protein
MTSHEKRHWRAKGEDWRDIEAERQRKPPAKPARLRTEEMREAKGSAAPVAASVATEPATEPATTSELHDMPPDEPHVRRTRGRSQLGMLLGIASMLGAGVPDMPASHPKPWRPPQ